MSSRRGNELHVQLIVQNSPVIFSDYSSLLFAVQSSLVIDDCESDGVVRLANNVVSLEICLMYFLNSSIFSNILHLTQISSKCISCSQSEVPCYGSRIVCCFYLKCSTQLDLILISANDLSVCYRYSVLPIEASGVSRWNCDG